MRTSPASGAVLACVALIAIRADAEPSGIAVLIALEGGPAPEVQIVAERSEPDVRSEAAVSSPGRPEPLVTVFRSPGETTLSLTPGLWVLVARAPGFWSAPQAVWVEPGGEPAEVRLDLWPVGGLAGTVAGPPGDRPPDRLTIRFQATPPAKGPPQGLVECPIADGGFECAIPAGRLDLRLRAAGFVSHYRWDVEVKPGERLALGRLDLQPGASLVGWVTTSDGALPKDETPLLVLRARQPPTGDDAEARRRRLLRLTERANDRGFFHFEALPPGGYRIYAKLDGYATEEADVDVLEDAESELLDPLVLSPARTLEVEIDPPIGPAGERWRLLLTRWRDRRSIGDLRATASDAGQWRQVGLPAGEYSLMVIDGQGARRLHHRFQIEAEDRSIALRVASFRVHGTVRIGTDPIAARVVYGGTSGAVSVGMASDEQGSYEGTLPSAGRWPVTIEASEPPVLRELEVVVDEEEAETDEGARLDFALPDTRLAGRVIDASGAPVRRGFVTVLQSTSLEVVRRPLSSDGSFEIHALPSGEDLTVHAEGPLGNSEPLTLELAEGDDREILLVLAPDLVVTVEVLSTEGRPIPGAQVLALPDVPNALAPIVTTGVDGRVALRNIPSRTHHLHLAVFAPGFASRLVRRPVADRETLTVEVDQFGGTLTIHLKGDDPQRAGRLLFVARDGARIGWQILQAFADRAPSEDGASTTLTSMEAGSYSLCLASAAEPLTNVTPDRCVSGRLDPLGHLDLRLELQESAIERSSP